MQKTGIVVELQGDRAVVMTRDGEFCRVVAPASTQVGSELRWTVVHQTPLRHTSRGAWRLGRWTSMGAAGAAAAVALAVGLWKVGTVHQLNAEPYAKVALDIRPGVTITVNRHLNVIDEVALNASGKRLLASVGTKNVSLQQAVSSLVQKAADDHMIPKQDNILIAATGESGVSDSKLQLIQDQVKSDVESVLAGDTNLQRSHAQVYAYQVSSQVWNAAVHLKVSPAKVAAYLSELQQGHPVKFNEVHTARLTTTSASVHLVKSTDQSATSLIHDALAQSKASATPTTAPSSASGLGPNGITTGTSHDQTGSGWDAGVISGRTFASYHLPAPSTHVD